MKVVELTSKNASYRYGRVLLTSKAPTAEVYDYVADAMLKSGRVRIVSEDTQDAPEEIAAVAITALEAATNEAAATELADTVADEVIVDDIQALTAEMIQNASTKADLIALADAYGVDVTGCSNKAEIRAALTAALEQ